MMMIILRSPFRRRQAPQTSAAPQPFQHWPPDKVHQSHGIDHHNQNIQKIIKLSKKDHQNLHLPAAEHHASSMPAKVLCNCQPVWSHFSFAFCLISCIMSVFFGCFPHLPNSFSGGSHNSNLCSDFLRTVIFRRVRTMRMTLTMMIMRKIREEAPFLPASLQTLPLA